MATNHTTNYELSQWLSTDQVLRTDFNADNAKIDAALHTVDLRRLQVLQSYALDEASSMVVISLEDLDWSQWRMVHIDVAPSAGSSDQLYVCYGRSFLDRIGVCSTTWNHLILLPYGQPEMRVTALFWGDSGSFFRAPNMTFSELTEVSMIGEYGSYELKVGTKILVRGEKL